MTIRTPENHPENGHPPGFLLPDLQRHVKLTREQREKATGNTARSFFESLFGRETAATNFLTNMTNWFSRFIGTENRAPTDLELFGVINKQRTAALHETEDSPQEADIEQGIVAHRGLGYNFRHPNTLHGMETAIRGGETELEFDVRIGPDGNLRIRHDPFDGTNPQEGGTTFDEAMALFQRHPNTRMFLDVKGGRNTVQQIVTRLRELDRAMANQPGYRPLLSRVAFLTFNPDAVPALRSLAPNCPILFNYFPTGGTGVLNDVLVPAYQRGFISRGMIARTLGAVDMLTGNTNLGGGFAPVSLHVNEQNPFSAPGSTPREERLTAYSMLPPPALVTMIRDSGGALSVPWPLVRDWPEFFATVRRSGVRLAIHGFEDPNAGVSTPEQVRARTLSHNAEVRRAIALGANIVITDHPNYFPNAQRQNENGTIPFPRTAGNRVHGTTQRRAA